MGETEGGNPGKCFNELFVVVAEPSAGNPLRFALQSIDFSH